ncbi:MAG: hypothetical protein ACRES2_05915, partial [Steroidobacteraceae bacterium]
ASEINCCPHLWVSGTESWFALASRGVWVEGCAESLGFAALRPTLAAPLLSLPPLREWLALTNEEGAAGWGEMPVLATYRHGRATEQGAGPGGALQAWWHSGIQFERWRGDVQANCQHACGPGKTADALRRAGIEAPNIFPSVRQWREWLRT